MFVISDRVRTPCCEISRELHLDSLLFKSIFLNRERSVRIPSVAVVDVAIVVDAPRIAGIVAIARANISSNPLKSYHKETCNANAI